MTNLNSKLLGGAAVALLAGMFAAPAQAQTVPLYAGGATFPEKVYRDIFNCYGNQSGGDTTVGLSGPLGGCNGVTPYRSNVEPLYLGVGSGNGKKAFVNHDSSKLTDGPRTPDAVPVPSTSDFGPYFGTGAGATWVRDTTDTGPFFPQYHFAGSDDPLLASDITTYDAVSGGHWGAPIQVPTLIGTVAIDFHQTATWNEKGKTITGASSKVQFSTPTWCGIYTGAITDWSDPAITADNAGFQLGNGPITVIYRNDSSGTTFVFVNAFINQCAATSNPVPASWQTAPGNASGVSNNAWFNNVKTAGLLNATYVGAPGNGGVAAGVNATVGAVGYNTPDFILPVDPSGPKAANLQTWISFITPLATKKFVSANPKSGTALMGALKAPINKALSCPVGTGVGQAADGNCAHNPLNWGLTNPMPTSAAAFPIGGFTFVDLYTCYASAADVNALVGTTAGNLGLFRWFFGSTTENATKVKTELTANGFSLVPGSWISGAKKLLTTDQKTKISTPGTAKTGCATVVGGGA